MQWFGKRPLATVEAAGTTELCIHRADATRLSIDVARLPWVAYLLIGDSFYGGEGGWCMLPDAGDAVAFDLGCPGAQPAIRGPLCQALDGASRRLLIELANPPKKLRAARDGIARLTAADASALCNTEYVTPFHSLLDLPWVP